MKPAVAGGEDQVSPHRRARWSLVVMGIPYVLLILPGLFAVKARFPAVVAGVGLFGLLGLVFAIRAATRRSLPSGIRRSWWLFSGGLLLINLVPVGLVMSGTLGPGVGARTGLAAPASFGDLFRLLAVLPILAGLLLVPRSHTTRRDGHKLLLDVVTVVGGSFMLLWYFVLGPVVTSHLPPLTMVVAAAYPIGDLTMIFGAMVVATRGAHLATRRPMIILLLGLLMLVASDTYLGYCKIHPEVTNYPTVQLTAMMTGLFLIAAAGLEQCLMSHADPAQFGTRLPGAGSRLPYVALSIGSGLLVGVSLRNGLYPWFGLIGGGVLMTAAVAVRQFITIRENHALIISDSLTGLSNRVRLRDGLTRAVDRANRTDERTAVLLIDMNGFKQINDTLGHDAGDQLLVAFADILKASVLGADIVARLGGDEFAIVLHNVGTAENAGTVANRIIAGIREPIAVNGKLVCPAASIGIAISAPGQPIQPAELLYRADMAMYRAKAQPGSNYHFYEQDPTAEYAAS